MANERAAKLQHERDMLQVEEAQLKGFQRLRAALGDVWAGGVGAVGGVSAPEALTASLSAISMVRDRRERQVRRGRT